MQCTRERKGRDIKMSVKCVLVECLRYYKWVDIRTLLKIIRTREKRTINKGNNRIFEYFVTSSKFLNYIMPFLSCLLMGYVFGILFFVTIRVRKYYVCIAIFKRFRYFCLFRKRISFLLKYPHISG